MLPKEYATVPIDSIKPFPGNARIGDKAVLRESLAMHDQFDDLIVQKATGHIIAGNNTWAVMKEQGATEVGVAFVDVDDEEATRMNLVHNRANDLATHDDRLRLEMLAGLPDLDGTGYVPGDLDMFEQSLTAPDLDDLAAQVGAPREEDGWPTIHARVPPKVMAAWNAHLSAHHKDEAAAMAALLGVHA